MQKANSGILILIMIIGIWVLIKIFDFNSNLEEINLQLNKTSQELNIVSNSITTAKNELDSLRIKIDGINLINDKHLSSRDSLVHLFKSEVKKNLNKVAELRQKQIIVKTKFQQLREQNDKFK